MSVRERRRDRREKGVTWREGEKESVRVRETKRKLQRFEKEKKKWEGERGKETKKRNGQRADSDRAR